MPVRFKSDSIPSHWPASLLRENLVRSAAKTTSTVTLPALLSFATSGLGTAKNEGLTVAEVVKTFGTFIEAETLDEFRYPVVEL